MGDKPDCESVNGVLVERKGGTQCHALLQLIIAKYLSDFRKSHRIKTFMAAWLQVGDRTRIADVMVLKVPYTKSKVIVDVPLVVAEVMSPDDTFDAVMEKCFEYAAFGVPYILVFGQTTTECPVLPGFADLDQHR